MTPLEAAHALALPVNYLGGRWMADSSVFEGVVPDGLDRQTFYFIGRAGALGDVSGAVAASALIFFPPQIVAGMWDAGRAVLTPAEALAALSTCCWTRGRRSFTEAREPEATIGLLERVIDSADAAALPLFAGWRAAPRPADAPARLAHLLHVLRELRGGLHGVAVLASGLRPIEATVNGFGALPGVANPETMGWPAPLPEATPALQARRLEAEELTHQLMAGVYAILEDQERADLVERVLALRPPRKTG